MRASFSLFQRITGNISTLDISQGNQRRPTRPRLEIFRLNSTLLRRQCQDILRMEVFISVMTFHFRTEVTYFPRRTRLDAKVAKSFPIFGYFFLKLPLNSNSYPFQSYLKFCFCPLMQKWLKFWYLMAENIQKNVKYFEFSSMFQSHVLFY